MNGIPPETKAHTEWIYFLSDLIGVKVLGRGGKIGKLQDLAIHEQERKLPEVTHLLVGRSFGRKPLHVPWERVRNMTHGELEIDIETEEGFEEEPGPAQILLRDYVLDKKVIDLAGREIDVVYDVKLVAHNNRLYVTDVDFSSYAKLKRLGLKATAQMLLGARGPLRRETVSWAYVQPLPEELGRFKGSVKLRVLKERLSEIHPVDLAAILEELDHRQSLALFQELDTAHASDTLEEIEPRVQRSLIASLEKERVAELIDEMTPVQAAGVLSALPAQDAGGILQLMGHQEAEKIGSLLGNHHDTIADLTTSKLITVLSDMPAHLVIAAYRKEAEAAEVLNYLYIVNHDTTLKGVVGLPELLKAKPEAHMKEIMTTEVVTLKPDDPIAQASVQFLRYGFRALPVVEGDGTIVGAVLYRDIMNLKHRFA